MKSIFFRLVICLITLTVFESCSFFGIEKIIIRPSEFTYTDNDILYKAKLYSIKNSTGEDVFFPIQYKVPAMVAYDNRQNGQNAPSYITTEYQPTILFLTKDRFVFNMGCTIYGKISKDKDNSFDIVFLENSNDCQAKEFSKMEALVLAVLKASTKCILYKDVIYLKKENELLMVYHVL